MSRRARSLAVAARGRRALLVMQSDFLTPLCEDLLQARRRWLTLCISVDCDTATLLLQKRPPERCDVVSATGNAISPPSLDPRNHSRVSYDDTPLGSLAVIKVNSAALANISQLAAISLALTLDHTCNAEGQRQEGSRAECAYSA